MKDGHYWLGDDIVKVERGNYFRFHEPAGHLVNEVASLLHGPILRRSIPEPPATHLDKLDEIAMGVTDGTDSDCAGYINP